MFLSKDQFLQANDLKREAVECPEAGEGAQVWARGLTAAERGRLVSSNGEAGERWQESYQAKLAALGSEDEDGNPLFEFTDYKFLMKKSATMIGRIAEAVERLSVIAPKAMEEAEKNSSEAQSEDLSSD